MTPVQEYIRNETRRQFLRRGGHVLGAAALASLLGESSAKGDVTKKLVPHFAPKAKQVIYLHMVGGPSQLDLYDYKPQLGAWYDKDLPVECFGEPDRAAGRGTVGGNQSAMTRPRAGQPSPGRANSRAATASGIGSVRPFRL